MTFPQTITTEQYEPQVKKIAHYLQDDVIVEFKVEAQIPENSFEDRQVFFAMDEYAMSMRGEEAIALGQLLVEQGAKALQSNMYQHHHIHAEHFLKQFIREGKVARVVFTVTDETPANHGVGWRTHSIRPVWAEGADVEGYEDFEFSTIMYWSPDEEEFQAQQDAWNVPVDIIGYNREEDVANFRAMQQQFEAQNNEQALAQRAEALGAFVEANGVEALVGLPEGPETDETDDGESDAREAHNKSGE